MNISVITPWHNCPELIPAYESAVRGIDQVIVIDNASDEITHTMLAQMMERLGGVLITNSHNTGYSEANNQGLERVEGEIALFLNNDIEAGPGWYEKLRASVRAGALYGQNLQNRYVDKISVPYLEGWCLAGIAAEIRAFGGWNALDFPGLYYEDNEFCWRAMRHGLSLRQIKLDIKHINNYTSSRTPGAFDKAEANRAVFEGIVRRDRKV